MDDFLEHFHLPTTIEGNVTSHPLDSSGRRSQEVWSRGKTLGRGAYGTVWLEKRKGTRDERAVKKVSKSIDMDHLKEIRAIAKFSKHNKFFAEFYGWYDDAEAYYLAMEYMPHGTLYDHLMGRGTPLPKRKIGEITGQLLEGLAFMHASNYAHRDLKPGNILIASPGPDWVVKIGDFGITKRITADAPLQTIGGTPAYSAPEMRGFVRDRHETDTYSYTTAVDIWALGVIVFEMLTLKLPFLSDKDLEAYYDEKAPFPTDVLSAAHVFQPGINFILPLTKARPAERPTALQALQAPWLQSYRDGEGARRQKS